MKPFRAVLMFTAFLLILFFVQGTMAAETYGYVTQWGSRGSGNGQFYHPQGIAVDSSGNVYIADFFNSRIEKFDSSGKYLTQWGSWGSGNGQFKEPFGVAVDNSGKLYVTDLQNHRIQKFDSDGNFLMMWGSPGEGDGQFLYPSGISIDTSGDVYVVDGRIQKFDSNGNFLMKWVSPGGGGPGISIDTSGNVYVVDELNSRIEKFNSDGIYLTQWGSQGTDNGQFFRPSDITVDTSGNIFVTDSQNNRIQKFKSDGTYITQWGFKGDGNGQFFRPTGIAIDLTGNVYVADPGNSRIQKFSKSLPGRISVTSNPAGAEIYLDLLGPYNKKVDTGQVTPFTFDSINPANHIIFVNLAGYHEASESVTVTESSTTVADFQLIPIPSGSIIVTSTPAGSEIYLDNTATGQVTPSVLSSVPEGNHIIKVTKSCFVTPDAKSVNVIIGGTVSADFVLVSDDRCFRQIPDFSANSTMGKAPLPVSFTDLSVTDPIGWAWFFGDENYAVPWTQITGNAGWSGGVQSLIMPDGNIVLMGGGRNNEVWRSTDDGLMWTRITEHAEWVQRSSQSSVVMPDGAIVLMGGFNDGLDGFDEMNDVWRSTDEGETWMQMTANAGWLPRQGFCSIAMPDGDIVLMGGTDQNYAWNDVWRSTDDGFSWTRMTANGGWSPRAGQSCVVLPDGSIVLMGGLDSIGTRNDVWRSTDKGATWIQVSSSADWTTRSGQSSVVMPDGSIILMGGNDDWYLPTSDIWRSTDGGATWTQVTANAEWSARSGHSSVVMPDGSILVIGGSGGSDVWRLNPAGSSAQNPLHVYTIPGTYQVSLQVYNESGFNSIRKSEYINVIATNAGNISVSSNPVGAKIFLDGEDTGHVTPFTLPDVAEGNHQVSLIKDCYITPDPQDVIVIAGETVTTDFTLQSTGSCIPEFPSMVVPAVVLVGCIGVMIFFGSRRQVTV